MAPCGYSQVPGGGIYAPSHMHQRQSEGGLFRPVVVALDRRGGAFSLSLLALVAKGLRRRNRLHLRLEHAGLLVAKLRFLFQGPEHYLVEAHVNLDLPRGRQERFARQFAGQQFIEDHAEGVNVGTAVHLLRIGLLLRGGVTRRAQGVLREALGRT